MAKLSTASIFCCGKCSRPVRRRLHLHPAAFTIARADARGRKYIYNGNAIVLIVVLTPAILADRSVSPPLQTHFLLCKITRCLAVYCAIRDKSTG